MSTLRAVAPYLITRRVLVALAYFVVFISCGDPLSPGGRQVARIEVAPSALAMVVGATRSIVARVVDESGATVPASRVFWSTENPTIVTVTQGGIVVAVAPGTTRIAVSSRGTSAIVPVTVSALQVSIVRVTPSTATLRAGSSIALRADAFNAAGDTVRGQPVVWSSGNEALATVSSLGVVSGVSPGVATITATVDGTSGVALVTIDPVPVASVRVTPATGALFVGQALQLTATTADSAGLPLAGRTITWASSAPAIATVSSTGAVNALAPGIATITATSEGQSGTSRLTASLVPVDAVSILPDAATTTIGRTVQLAVRLTDAAGAELSGRLVTWVSDQPGIASVSADGVVTAIATGRALITATSEGKSGRSTIDVTPIPVASLTVTPTSATLPVGSSRQFIAIPRDAQGAALTGRIVTWISGAPSVASVSQSGLVTAIGVGTALVIAISEEQRASITLTATPAPVAQVSVSPLSATLNPDSTLQFSAVARDASGNVLTGRATSWTSSNAAVATVSTTGLVTGVAVGSAQISALVEGSVGTATLTVSLVPVARITLAPNPSSIIEGQTSVLTASVTDARGNALSGRTLAWTSSNVGVANVSQSGVVTAITPGTTTITAAAPNAGIGGTTPSGSGAVVVTFAPVAAVSIVPSAPTITIGTPTQLTVTLQSAPPVTSLDPTTRTLTWSVADPSIATISATGVVTGVVAGTTSVTVSASSPGQVTPATNTVTLAVSLVPIARVVLTPLAGTIHLGTLYARQVSAQAFDAGNRLLVGRSIAWSTSNASQLVVAPALSGNGVSTITAQTAPAAGLLVIASAPGATGVVSDTLTISSDLVQVSAVAVTPPSATLTPLQTQTLAATASDSAGNVIGTLAGNPLGGRLATWSSANAAIGSVSAAGVVTAVSVGNTTISAVLGGASPATFALTVVPVPVATVGVSAPDSSLTVGNVIQATVVARDASGNILSLTGRTVVWSSVSTSIASISASGLLTAVGAGNTTIGVTVDGVGPATFSLSVAAAVVVPLPVATVSVTAPDSSLTVGSVALATVVARDASGNILTLTGRTVVWSSSATGVATVSATGIITAVGAGSTTIGVSVDGVGPATLALSVAPIPVASVSVTAPDSSLTTGAAAQATVVARDVSGNILTLTGRTVVWTSSATGVASVSASGLVTAVGTGSATIGVTVDGVGPATFALIVSPAQVATVSVTAPDSSLTTGTVAQATVVARDAANNILSLTGRSVAWTSSATSVATISATGLITAVSAGSATIGVSVDGVGPATFAVVVSPVPVTSVTVSAPDSSLFTGNIVQATVVARDVANNILSLTGRSVVWTSSATSIATISATGLVSALSAGSATIGVTVDGIGPATFALTVAPAQVASVSVTAPDSSLTTGTVVQATVVARDAASNILPLTGRAVVWTSSASAVATISATGLVTAVGSGGSTISVTVDGVGPATFPVVVTPVPVTSVTVSAPDSSIFAGNIVQATVVARDLANNILSLTGRSVVWTSSAIGIATISATGLVTAVSAGSTTVGVSVDGVGPATFTLTVAAVPVASVSVSAPDSSLTTRDVIQATVVARDASNNALPLTGRTVVWTSSATGVVTVSTTGLITAVGAGSATIGVTVDGVGPATIALTVAPTQVASVGVTATDSSLTVGTSAQATVVARDAANNNLPLTGRTVVWTSSASGVASVSTAGLITAVGAGSTTIGVTVDGVGPATMAVIVAPVPVASVSVTSPDSSLTPGTVVQAVVIARDAANNTLALTGRTVVWTSSAAGVATISATGLITAVGAGSTSIGVTVDGVGPATFALTVAPAQVASVSVAAPDSSLTTGDVSQATVVARDAASNLLSLVGRTVVWTSSASGVATVSTTGLITAVGAGSATIGVTVDGVGPATFTLTVAPVPVRSVTVSAPDSSLFTGNVVQATVIARDAAGNILPLVGRTVVWSSSATAVATISATGLVTAVGAGSTTIGVTVDGVGPATIALTVAPAQVASVSVTAPDSSLTTGSVVQATVIARDAANNILPLTGRVVVWTSSVGVVASVSATGLVTAVGVGSATIGVTVDGVGPASFPFTVAPVPVSSVTVSATDSSIFVGNIVQATVVARDASNNILSLAGRTIGWTSNASGVATVSTSGLITAVGAGSSTIGVTVDGIGPATFALIVAPPVVASVSVTAPDSSVTTGAVLQATVIARDASNNSLPLTGRTILWSSSVTGVATVSTSGLITTVGAGGTTISVSVDGVGPATFSLTVAAVPVASVSVTASDSSLTTGTVVQATVIARDLANNILPLTGRSVVWTTSATGVATVSASGLITAVGAGSSTIGVTVDGVGPATIALSVAPPQVASVSVTAPDSSLTVGTVAQASVVARDAANNILPLTGRTVVWSSSATGVATVSATGLISAVNTGSATIGVTVDGVGPATFTLTVAAVSVSTVSVTAPDSSLTTGDVVQATVVARDAANNLLSLTGRIIVWTSSATSVASVSTTGSISAAGPGSTTIGVTVDGVGPAMFVLSVAPVPVASVTVSAPDSSLIVGDPPMQATVVPRDGAGNILPLAGRTVVWSSSATGVAMVSSAGLVTVVGVGTSTMSVTVDGVGPASFVLTVSQVPVSRVDVTPPTATRLVGDVSSFVATPRDAAGNALTNRSIVWNLSNAKASITPVSGGSTTLTTLDSGLVILSATSEGKSGVSTLTISLVPVDTIESVPSSPTPTVKISAGAGHSSREMFRAISLSAGKLSGRAFTVTTSDSSIATVAAVAPPVTDSAGKGDFIVTLTAAAVAGNTVNITVTIEGKSTIWKVTVT